MEDLVAAKEGNTDAFRALVDPHLSSLYYTASLVLLDRDLAKDAVQEALVRAFYSLKHFREGSFRSWLRRIVVNEAKRFYVRRRSQLALVEELPKLIEESCGSEKDLLAVDERLSIITALGQMPEIHRTVIVLRYFEELSEAEIAQTLRVRVGTVKSRLHSARKALREVLSEPDGLLASLPERRNDA